MHELGYESARDNCIVEQRIHLLCNFGLRTERVQQWSRLQLQRLEAYELVARILREEVLLRAMEPGGSRTKAPAPRTQR